MLGLTQFGRKCDLIYQWCDKKKSEVAPVRPAIQKKKMYPRLCLPVVQQQTHIRLISWSKPIRDSEDSFTSISKKSACNSFDCKNH